MWIRFLESFVFTEICFAVKFLEYPNLFGWYLLNFWNFNLSFYSLSFLSVHSFIHVSIIKRLGASYVSGTVLDWTIAERKTYESPPTCSLYSRGRWDIGPETHRGGKHRGRSDVMEQGFSGLRPLGQIWPPSFCMTFLYDNNFHIFILFIFNIYIG